MDRRLALKTLSLPAALGAARHSSKQPEPARAAAASWPPTFVSVQQRAALAKYGHAFPLCTEQQQLALLAALARAAENGEPASDKPPPFILELRKLSIWALCDSQLGATSVLQYEPVPGDFEGCVPLSEVGKAWAG